MIFGERFYDIPTLGI